MEKSAINPHTKNDSLHFHTVTNKLGEGVKLRTIFMGTSEFAAEILESLINAGYNIISVYTQPDKKSGRNQEIISSAVKIFSEKNQIPIFQPSKFDESAIEEIKRQKPDMIVLAAYGKIIPVSVLKIPGFGALNVHASLLPKYRGPSPIQNAILNGESETGVTIMLMNEHIDTGSVLSQQVVTIDKNETAADLSKNLAKISSGLLLETLPQWIERRIDPQKQDDTKTTLCQLIEKSDGKIIWSDDAESIYNRYRAFTPWPGIFCFWEKDDALKRIKLNKIACLRSNPESKHSIGEVFQLGVQIGVQTSLGVILLEEIQIEGKPNIKIDEFLNGYPDFIGSVLK